jgi:hypothetical protein
MADGREYRFHIDAFTPDTLPMERLSPRYPSAWLKPAVSRAKEVYDD